MRTTVSDKRREKPTYPVKDDAGFGGSTQEPETHADVVKEIQRMGDNVKSIHADLMEKHTALRKLVDKQQGEMEALDTAKYEKLVEDITTKQQMLEQQTTKRMDDIEKAVQRFHHAGAPDGEEGKELRSLATQFNIARKVVWGQYKSESEDIHTSEELTQLAEELRGYQPAFRKYLRRSKEAFSEAEFKQLSVGIDPDGGILVTPQMANRIVERIYEDDPIRALAAVETIGTDAFEIMEDLDEAGASWETETDATDETDSPRFNKVRIPVHIQSARPRATQKLLDDASINMEQWLANKLARKFARSEGAAFVNGNGVGKPRGFLTYDAWTTAGMFEFGKIEQINMGHATALTTDGFIDVLYSLLGEYQTRATWLMNRLTVRDTMKLKDGDGQYIWRPGLQPGQPSVILGVPLRMATTMPVVAANALAVALADWREAYTIVDRQGIVTQRDPFTVKPLVEFYTRKRVGAGCVNFQALKLGKIST